MKAVIMAGGKGTRLSPVTGDRVPKPMAPLCGRPVLEHQICRLKENGISEILLVIGYLHETIQAYFGDGSAWGVRIHYIIEEIPLGTAGALHYLKNFEEESVLLLFGDIIFDIDVARMNMAHEQSGADVTLLVHPNSHPYDSDLVVLDRDGWVSGFDSKENDRDYFYKNLVNAGIYIIRTKLFQRISGAGRMDLEKDFLLPLLLEGARIYGYRTTEYVKDIGSPERFGQTEADMKKGIIKNKNLKYGQRCIFLDRDGTINKYRGLIAKPEQLELTEGAGQAIRRINESGYLAVVITNQPAVARNLCSLRQLEDIHNKMETLLGKEGAYLDAIYYCPHHPDKGYAEENPAYKIECGCRKPKTGMISRCIRDYHVEPSASWMVGDTTTDIQTGKNAGLKTILVKTGQGGRDGKYAVRGDAEQGDLPGAVEYILGRRD